MSKKYKLIINIAMVIIGIIGMVIYYTANNNQAVQPQGETLQVKAVETPKESITVAIARKELKKGIRLTSEDFKLETIQVEKDSGEAKQFSVGDIDNWMVKSDVAMGGKIPATVLVEPGSDEYIQMSAKSGSIVYGFSIQKSDSYLFTNLRAGEGIDIYLAYMLRENRENDELKELIPTADMTDSINNRHFKLIMKNKKILSIRSQSLKMKKIVDQSSPMDNEGYILVELSPAEVMTLKGLENKSIYLFPTNRNDDDMSLEHSVLVGSEGQWPIDNRNILFTNTSSPAPIVVEQVVPENLDIIKEYRGSSSTNTTIENQQK
ncbi:hypothetical protein [Kluyvera sp. 142486]|uniref:hypothetical protein n=1 Tax=Kluyvera sp. 142486 TaxID=3390050 RepID=UPI00397EA98F